MTLLKDLDGFVPVPKYFIEHGLPKVSSLIELKIILILLENAFDENTGKIDFEKTYFSTMQELASKVGHTNTSIMTAITSLVENNIIEKIVVSRKNMGYKLVPSFFGLKSPQG